jgi:DNA modification methylase
MSEAKKPGPSAHLFYEDENVTLFCGDSFEILPRISVKFAEVVITDPPYELSPQQIVEIDSHFLRVANGKIVFMPPENQWVNSDQFCFWIKPISTKNTSKRYSRFVEMIFIGGNLQWNTGRHWSQYTNVFADLVEGETDHPYEKPVSLIRRLVLNHTNPGQAIIDPFAGSGTTLVAA